MSSLWLFNIFFLVYGGDGSAIAKESKDKLGSPPNSFDATKIVTNIRLLSRNYAMLVDYDRGGGGHGLTVSSCAELLIGATLCDHLVFCTSLM